MSRRHGNWFKSRLAIASLLACFAFHGLPLAIAADKLERFEFVQIRMGIPVRIVVYADQQTTAIQASDAAFERIRKIDRTLSDYDPDSEVRKLTTAPVGKPVLISDDLFTVATAAQQLSHQSQGAFDITVGPIVKLWRVARRKHVLPDEHLLKESLQHVGSQFLELDAHHRTITFNRPGMQLDFGGIAKGYAADEAYRVLKAHNLSCALVAAAGDIRVGDPPPGTAGWRVEVEERIKPPGPERKPVILTLSNCGISTSGDTYQYLEIDGVRYSHIVDPKTGLGITTPGSVTVLAPTAMQADGLASTVSILGPEHGLELIRESPQTEALIVRLEQDGTRSVNRSAHWPVSPNSPPGNHKSSGQNGQQN